MEGGGGEFGVIKSGVCSLFGLLLSHSLSSLPWAFTSKLTWSLLIQITLTMHANGNHVSPQKLHKNALAQIPMTLLQREIYSRAQTAQRLSECFFREFPFNISRKFNNQKCNFAFAPCARIGSGVTFQSVPFLTMFFYFSI